MKSLFLVISTLLIFTTACGEELMKEEVIVNKVKFKELVSCHANTTKGVLEVSVFAIDEFKNEINITANLSRFKDKNSKPKKDKKIEIITYKFSKKNSYKISYLEEVNSLYEFKGKGQEKFSVSFNQDIIDLSFNINAKLKNHKDEKKLSGRATCLIEESKTKSQ